MSNKKVKKKGAISPFLKWPGGKRWLVNNYSEFFPEEYNTYIEPFMGSASVFFYLQPKKAILSDVNTVLVKTYQAIQNSWEDVVKQLTLHHQNHCKDYYYLLRKEEPETQESIAARMIYLNRTCFNAIYRVNKQGKFNVPIGTKKNVLLPTDDFPMASKLLNKAKIINEDFESVIKKAKKGDFLYVDPPYTVKHNNNGFLKYNETLFSWEDQVRLMQACTNAKKRGVRIMISNADHQSIHELYEGFGRIEIVSRYSVIAASSNKRKPTTEVLIMSY